MSIARRTAISSRLLPVFLSIVLALGGCGLQHEPKLDADDLRFAAFYGDYLSRSGVTPKGKAAPYTDLSPAGLDSLLTLHGLDQATFDARLQAYSENPRLWLLLLEQVQKELRQKEE